jgi:hypothetical protein
MGSSRWKAIVILKLGEGTLHRHCSIAVVVVVNCLVANADDCSAFVSLTPPPSLWGQYSCQPVDVVAPRSDQSTDFNPPESPVDYRPVKLLL